MSQSREAREFLRHTLATLAYRGGKALAGVPASFGSFRAADGSRSACEILAHLGDLLDWAIVYAADGRHEWHDSPPGTWEEGSARFFAGLAALDAVLASEAPLGIGVEKIFQGPIADAFTHVGQIALLRRLAGLPVRGENYLRADIVTGRVGREQSAPRREFE